MVVSTTTIESIGVAVRSRKHPVARRQAAGFPPFVLPLPARSTADRLVCRGAFGFVVPLATVPVLEIVLVLEIELALEIVLVLEIFLVLVESSEPGGWTRAH